ncbi:MAG: hypothetical protein KA984_01285 [Candidatus Cloacimonetes bacterium]|nr:hypothetical protein [Candidatus Cloacimonadota bacterium]
MKVKMNGRPWAYSGKADDLVFCYNRFSGTMYARKKARHKSTAENERIGDTSRSIFGLNPSAGFKKDLQLYLLGYNRLRENRDKPVQSWSAMYLHLMHAMTRKVENVNLQTITREEIYLRSLPCVSIRAAVEAGVLPAVNGWEGLERLL